MIFLLHELVNSRERTDTLGGVSNIPDLDVSGGNGEDETGGVPVMKTNNYSGENAIFPTIIIKIGHFYAKITIPD